MGIITSVAIGKHRDVAFELRGERIVYKVPSQTINYGTGAITSTDTETVIPLALIGKVSKGESWTRTFSVKTASLPVSVPLVGHKIEYDSSDWIVQDSAESATGYVTVIYTTKA